MVAAKLPNETVIVFDTNIGSEAENACLYLGLTPHYFYLTNEDELKKEACVVYVKGYELQPQK